MTKVAARREIKNATVIEVRGTPIMGAVIGTEGTTEGTTATLGEVAVDLVVQVVVGVTGLMVAHSMVLATHLQIIPIA